MDKNKHYKRFILQNQIDDCKKIVESSKNNRKTIVLDDDDKDTFYQLGSIFIAFLTKNDDRTQVKDLAKVLSATHTSTSRLFFNREYDGFKKDTIIEILDNAEQVADKYFGTLEEAEAQEKEVVC
ncbi:hypothetical protein [Staphylococcus warneri]|uniref:hypothetical protein n=1 Tax=Staphylococcus warneri TaxID=1292 RepID=UPI001FB25BFF|nr:hypothetical protein [Staphylococcus warneri]MCJ1788030.1 hypothetical protein [Staphylococcus warneri]MCJ1792937.1 hypothetical protein [Staphylococcus warneri]MCJ1795421.1 hypothetical protein [Staphylococcus warneri]MCJ1797840.1 hypothetical protein [Staphylococcus warneri]MCJ1800371.1 hypothetical protein [Staphylococcus warneri]